MNNIVINCCGISWQLLRKLVLLRDKNTCQGCGKQIAHFHVHHIDFDKTNNSPINLTTFCVQCHEKTHMLKKHLDSNKILFIKKLLIDNNFTISGGLAPLTGLTQPSISEFIEKVPASFTKLNNLKEAINSLLGSDYTIEELFALVDID